MSGKTFLRPGIDPVSGSPFRVYVPARGRDILPEGEALLLDSYLERRVRSGELVIGQPEPTQTTGRRARQAATEPPTPGD